MPRFTWIQTHTGKKFDYENPTVEMIDIRDIARALSRTLRFVTHTSFPITVAEHSMYVAFNLPEKQQFEGLLHDAAEAYTGDIPAPLKGMLGDAFKSIEEPINRVIAEKFGLEYPWHPRVKGMDYQALCEEARFAFPGGTIEQWHRHFDKGILVGNERLRRKLQGHKPTAEEIEEEFMQMFTRLSLERELTTNPKENTDA